MSVMSFVSWWFLRNPSSPATPAYSNHFIRMATSPLSEKLNRVGLSVMGEQSTAVVLSGARVGWAAGVTPGLVFDDDDDDEVCVGVAHGLTPVPSLVPTATAVLRGACPGSSGVFRYRSSVASVASRCPVGVPVSVTVSLAK